jgi:succinate dehydrogenase hydrophobic anchor subunit
MLSLVALPIAFVLFDYMAGSRDVTWNWLGQWLAIWLRSRLIEPWFYSGTLLAFVLFLVHSSRGERQILQSVLMVGTAVYILGPLLLPAQLVANLAYLLARALGI